MKASHCFSRVDDDEIFRQLRIDCSLEHSCLEARLRFEANHLSARVNASVGTASALNADRLAGDLSDRML
jgi:hypothetical protein